MLTRCGTRSLPISFGLTKCVMPKRSPQALRSLLMSTPMIMSAPASRRPWITLSPMPPSPNTIAFAPGSTLAVLMHRADAGGDAAADVADLVERRVLADLRDRDLGQHGEVREGRAAHVVMHRLAADREARGAVRHQALALRGADRGAEVGLARQAGRALPAFRRVERDDVVALLDGGDARADVDHDARALMAEDRRKQPFRVGAGQREFVGVADAGRLDLDHHLALARALELHGRDLQRLSGRDGDGGADIHGIPRSRYQALICEIALGSRRDRFLPHSI